MRMISSTCPRLAALNANRLSAVRSSMVSTRAERMLTPASEIMEVTSFKPNAELYDFKTYNPFLIASPTLDHVRKLLFDTAYPRWVFTTMTVAVCATVLSLLSSTLAAEDHGIARLTRQR